jgi:hypothetical protein
MFMMLYNPKDIENILALSKFERPFYMTYNSWDEFQQEFIVYLSDLLIGSSDFPIWLNHWVG